MSQARLVLLLVLATVLIFPSPSLSLAQVTNYELQNPSSTSGQIASAQVALIDCSRVKDLPGFAQLCGAIKSVEDGLNTLGTSITTALAKIPENFINILKTKSWEIVFNYILTPLLQGTSRTMLQGIDPTTNNPQISSLDGQAPPQSQTIWPMRLLAAVFDNPPNLGTLNSLAYTIDQNLLGVGTANAQLRNCEDWKALHPNENCPGRLRLNPMFRIWEGIRNIAYLAITLVLIVYGFMVMFRSKIDPRTVITVQSALPRLAIGLLGIAFSYTIASLAVDIGQVGLSSVGIFFNQVKVGGPGAPPLQCILNNAPCQPFPYLERIVGLNEGLFSKLDFKLTLDEKNPFFNGLAGIITAFIAWYIVFQVFFALITNYAQIFVKTALGPIMIAVGIIPTQSNALAGWFKGLLANSLVFPGVYFIVNIAIYINNYVGSLSLPSPLNGDVKGFVTLGLFVIASKVPAVIEEFLGTQASGAVARAGADVSQVARKIPVVGGLIG